MLEFGLFQLPDISESVSTLVWLGAGAIGLLLLWEAATFVAYVLGFRHRDRAD